MAKLHHWKIQGQFERYFGQIQDFGTKMRLCNSQGTHCEHYLKVTIVDLRWSSSSIRDGDAWSDDEPHRSRARRRIWAGWTWWSAAEFVVASGDFKRGQPVDLWDTTEEIKGSWATEYEAWSEELRELQTMAEERQRQSWFRCVVVAGDRTPHSITIHGALERVIDGDETTAAIGTSLIAGVWSEKTRPLHNSRLSKTSWRQARPWGCGYSWPLHACMPAC